MQWAGYIYLYAENRVLNFARYSANWTIILQTLQNHNSIPNTSYLFGLLQYGIEIDCNRGLKPQLVWTKSVLIGRTSSCLADSFYFIWVKIPTQTSWFIYCDNNLNVLRSMTLVLKTMVKLTKNNLSFHIVFLVKQNWI